MPRNKRKRRRRKSAKRVARGKKLARKLPRDEKGKFLPAGSKNLFRRKKKRRRRRSVPAKKRSQKKQVKRAKLTRRKSLPIMSRRKIATKDNFPNFISGFIIMDGGSTFTQKTINTPIPRLKTIGNRATVMELLYCDIVQQGVSFFEASTVLQFQMTLGTVQAVLLPWSDTRVFLDYRLVASGSLTDPLPFLTAFGSPVRYQFQTMDGFGYLLASDSFRIGVNAFNTPDVARIDFKLYYRFVDIPLSEFIGIVQSTQAQ